MEKENRALFEAYKLLESVCRECVSADKGVTGYIDYMTQIVQSDKRIDTKQPAFRSDLKTLKHLRWVRNRLSHEPGAFSEQLCTLDDVLFLKVFADRIQKRKDPLSLYGVRLGSSATKPAPTTPTKPAPTTPTKPAPTTPTKPAPTTPTKPAPAKPAPTKPAPTKRDRDVSRTSPDRSRRAQEPASDETYDTVYHTVLATIRRFFRKK